MALPYELDGHAYDDAERVRDNKRQVTNYCPLCEHYARSAEKLNDENRALREENARLKKELSDLPLAEKLRRAEIVYGPSYREQLTCIDLWLNRREPVKYESATLRHVQEEVERLTRERDELQDHERQTHERLGAILGTDDSLEECAKRAIRERDEARAELASLKDTVRVQQEAYLAEHEYWGACKWKAEVKRKEDWHPPDCEAVAWSEVKRLEGLILDWDEMDYDGDGRAAQALEVEARRIRAQREEGGK